MSENTSRTLLEEANNTVSEKTEDQRKAPTLCNRKRNSKIDTILKLPANLTYNGTLFPVIKDQPRLGDF